MSLLGGGLTSSGFEASDGAEHPRPHRTKNYLAQNVNRVKLEKLLKPLSTFNTMYVGTILLLKNELS